MARAISAFPWPPLECRRLRRDGRRSDAAAFLGYKNESIEDDFERTG